jgi:hypothetical protein
MKYFSNPNVIYLENSEFSGNKLTSSATNRTGAPLFGGLTILMVQGLYCGYCTQSKGMFQHLADDLTPRGIDFATIQIDGTRPGERVFKDPAVLATILGRPMEGVPLFAKFVKGRVVDIYSGPRDYKSLRAWIES